MRRSRLAHAHVAATRRRRGLRGRPPRCAGRSRRARRARLPRARVPRRAHDRARAAAAPARSGDAATTRGSPSASSRCCRSSQRSGVRLVSNFGAANPLAAADAIVAIARRLRIPVKVAAVTGDDVLDALDLDAPTMEGGVAAVALRADRVGQRLSRRRGAAARARERRRHRRHRPRRRSVAVRRAADARVRLGARTTSIASRAAPRSVTCSNARGSCAAATSPIPGRKEIPGHGEPRLSVRRRRRRRQRDARQGRRHRRAHHARDRDRAAALRSHRSARLSDARRHRRLLVGDADRDRRRTASRCAARAAGRGRRSSRSASATSRATSAKARSATPAPTRSRARSSPAQILRERLHGRFAELRIDLVGSTSLHGRAFDTDERPYEVRLRVAARAQSREEAAIVGDEVEALYTNGPAGGGGTRKYVNEQIGIVSTLHRPRARDDRRHRARMERACRSCMTSRTAAPATRATRRSCR